MTIFVEGNGLKLLGVIGILAIGDKILRMKEIQRSLNLLLGILRRCFTNESEINMKQYHIDNYIVLGKKYFEEDNLEQALFYFLKAYQLGRFKDIDLMLNMAIIYDELDEFDKALNIYEEIIDCDETEARAYYGIAILYDHQDEFDKAIDYYQKAIAYDPYYVKAYFFLAYAYDSVGEEDKAIDSYQKVLELDPEDFWSLVNLGAIYENHDKIEEAMTLMERALAIDEGHHMALFNMGVLLSKQHKINAAKTYYQKTIKITKNYPYAYLNLGVIYRDEGRYDRAIRIFTEGIMHNEEAVFLYYNRGCCYLKVNSIEAAEQDIINVLRKHPKMADYVQNDRELQELIHYSDVIKSMLEQSEVIRTS